MKRLILAGCLLTGCTTVQRTVKPITAAPVRNAIESADGSTQKAASSARQARNSLGLAEARTSALLRIAAPSERPILGGIKASLSQTHTELDATLNALAMAHSALADSENKVQLLQGEIDRQTDALRCAGEEARRQKASADFWKGVALKLSLLCLALVIWTFRKPIAAMFGMPIL